MTTLSTAFGSVSLLLACFGLYGVISYTVARRTSEIGIRMALGATRSGMVRAFMTESLALVVVGIVAGALTTVGVTRLIASRLFGVGAADPATMATGIALVVLAGGAGSGPAGAPGRPCRPDGRVAIRMSDEPLIRDISDTARWMAAYRARESERPDAVFTDPFARALAGERGEQIATCDPVRRRERVGVHRADVRVRSADRARAGAPASTLVVNLAAGLDARPYRAGAAAVAALGRGRSPGDPRLQGGGARRRRRRAARSSGCQSIWPTPTPAEVCSTDSGAQRRGRSCCPKGC